MSEEMYDITCARCGEPGQVPFEPEGNDELYCQSCHELLEEDPSEREDMYAIICAQCGEEAAVPFEPDDIADVYCRSCYEEVERKRHRQAEQTSPRKQHGTRVACQITCAECGREAELDYVPKGISLEEALCPDCLSQQQDESSRWSEVQDRKIRERKSEWSIECARCGDTDYLHFEPDDNRDYYCTRCYHEHEEPSDDERLDDLQSVGRNVYVPGSSDES